MAADDFSYLASLSAHPNRPGDTSNFDPVFASRLANAFRDAHAQGLNVGLESGYRQPTQTGSSFDRSGRSLHSYGLAADISGLGYRNSAAAQQWARIAAANGIYNPYGIGNASEFNHWQAIPNELTQADVPRYQQAFAARMQGGPSLAYAGSANAAAPAVAAINRAAGPGQGLTGGVPSTQAAIADAMAYARQKGLDPNLVLGIARAEGLNAWSANNPNAQSFVKSGGVREPSFGDFQLNMRPGAVGAQALAAGIDPRDPTQRIAANHFAIDYMARNGVGAWTDPFARRYAAGGAPAFNAASAANYAGAPGTSINSVPLGQGGHGSDYVASLMSPTAGNAPVTGGAPSNMLAGPLGGFLGGLKSEGVQKNLKQAADDLGGGDQQPAQFQQMTPLMPSPEVMGRIAQIGNTARQITGSPIPTSQVALAGANAFAPTQFQPPQAVGGMGGYIPSPGQPMAPGQSAMSQLAYLNSPFALGMYGTSLNTMPPLDQGYA